MNEILSLNTNDMAGCQFNCSCGRHHNFSVHDMSIGKGAINDLPKMASAFKEDDILVVFDNNTYKVAGKKAVDILQKSGFKHVRELLFDCGDNILIPKEETFGRIISEINNNTKLIIGVGGGVINDSCKFVTSRTKMPFIIVATAPSMDGYVSDSAAIFSQGKKLSVTAHLTYGLIGDTEILQTAPQDLIQAGFGDVVGKITALTDWDLATIENGDYRCDTCVSLVQNALDKCFSKAAGLKTRDEESLGALLEALTLTGVAMSLINITRPASGAEHMISHFWEMDYIGRGLDPLHHGVMVGAATPVVCRIFEMLNDILPESTKKWCWPHQKVEELLNTGGAAKSPIELGISKDLFYHSILEGWTVRPRYSILQFAKDKGLIEKVANELTQIYYEKEA